MWTTSGGWTCNYGCSRKFVVACCWHYSSWTNACRVNTTVQHFLLDLICCSSVFVFCMFDTFSVSLPINAFLPPLHHVWSSTSSNCIGAIFIG